jgi:hypothetical protein
MRERLWWCLPALVLCAADGLITFWGQPAAYWSGGFVEVNEGNPLAAWLLTVHPLAFAASAVPYLLVVLGIVVVLPRRWAAAVAVALASAHALAVGLWCLVLLRQGLLPLAAGGLVLVVLGVLMWRRSRVQSAEPVAAAGRPRDRRFHGLQDWLRLPPLPSSAHQAICDTTAPAPPGER